MRHPCSSRFFQTLKPRHRKRRFQRRTSLFQPRPASAPVERASADGVEEAAADLGSVLIAGTTPEETFVIDLGEAPEEDVEEATGAVNEGEAGSDVQAVVELTPQAESDAAPEPDGPSEAQTASPAGSRFQAQGNSLLEGRDTGAVVRRFGNSSDETEPSETADTPAAAESGKALIDFAASSDAPAGSPLLSVVLIDDGGMSGAAEALAGLPFPVTVALDPKMADAQTRMGDYRADGFELAVVSNLPEDALVQDVAITFESVFNTLPETLALVDLGAGGLQSDREVISEAMRLLAGAGRGYINLSQGLNAAGRGAETAGVPVAEIYRDIDGDDQDARVIRRFIDQAAFRARQESGVVLLGRVRPDTISALILWGTVNQGSDVAFVPLSAILTQE